VLKRAEEPAVCRKRRTIETTGAVEEQQGPGKERENTFRQGKQGKKLSCRGKEGRTASSRGSTGSSAVEGSVRREKKSNDVQSMNQRKGNMKGPDHLGVKKTRASRESQRERIRKVCVAKTKMPSSSSEIRLNVWHRGNYDSIQREKEVYLPSLRKRRGGPGRRPHLTLPKKERDDAVTPLLSDCKKEGF